MNIILGSTNESKERSIKIAFDNLGYKNLNITRIDVDSKVNSKPVNNDILIGAQNRNSNLYQHCYKNHIPFDFLISIEGGYEKINDNYFIVTYASIIDKFGEEFIGKSQGLQISKKMFEWINQGKSLNKVIESILENKTNKKTKGITGFLTDDYYRRDLFESTAVISAMQSMINHKTNYKKLEDKLFN